MSRFGESLRVLLAGPNKQAPEAAQSSAPTPGSTKMVGRALDWFARWTPDESHAANYLDKLLLRDGVDVYLEMPKQSETIASALRLLIYSRLSTELQVTARSDQPIDIEAADLVTHNIDRLRKGGAQRVNEDAMSAFKAGFSVQTFNWTQPEKWESRIIQRIDSVRALPPQTIAFDVDEFGEVRDNGVWQSKSRQTVLPGYHESQFDHLPLDQCIVWQFSRESGHPYGESLLRPCYRWYMAEKNVLLNLLRYCEFFGLPIVQIGMTGSPDDVAMAQVLARAKRMMGGQTFVSTDEMTFEIHEVTHTSTTVMLEALKYFSQRQNRALLQPSLLMEGGDTVGSNALGQSHKSTYTWIIDMIGHYLEREVWRDQFALPIVRRNLGENVDAPEIYFEEFEPRDVNTIIAMLKAAKELDATFTKSFARTMLGIEAPAEDEDEDEIIGKDPLPTELDPNSEDADFPEKDDRELSHLSEGLRALYFDGRNAKAQKHPDALYEVMNGNGKLSGHYVREGLL